MSFTVGVAGQDRNSRRWVIGCGGSRVCRAVFSFARGWKMREGAELRMLTCAYV